MTPSRAAVTAAAGELCASFITGHSRVKLSITVSKRILRPSASASETKSIAPASGSDPGPARIEEHEGELATCAVVWHALRYGVARLPVSKKRHAIETYLQEVVRTALPILPYDEESAIWHARERARLGRRGRPPAAADGQIAAIARVNELVLVTANVRDFRRFEDLSVQDWSR
jgi:tRNA(fMet)-specific endonuclease VapC